MTYNEMVTKVKDYDSEHLAWWTTEETESMGLQFRTLEKLQDNGILVYNGNDDLYFGIETYKVYYN